jgi:uncharacterized protein (DUF302 family)
LSKARSAATRTVQGPISQYGFEETLRQLRDAIAAVDLWVIHEIDPQALLKRGGFAIAPLRQLLWFHPRLMARLLLTDPGAVPEVPLKFVVSTEPAGIRVRALNPIEIFSPYRDLEPFAKDLFDVTNRMLSAVSAESSELGRN